MRIAVVFDTPYLGWDHAAHQRQMEKEIAAWDADEPEMEYQIANALLERGHEVRLLGVRDDLEELIRKSQDQLNRILLGGGSSGRWMTSTR
jgi:hypothetical protein